MKLTYATLSITLLLCFVGCSSNNTDGLPELEAIAREYLKAMESEDLEAVLKTIHTGSPVYAYTNRTAKDLFKKFNLKYKSLQFRYIGQDGEYAIARFEYTTERTSGKDYKSRSHDTIQVYRKEDGKWKIWSEATLGRYYR